MPTVEPHPIRVVVEDDLSRSRLTVFFRLLLLLPHVVWLYLWAMVAFFAAIVSWLTTLVLGRPAQPLWRFLAAFVRYATHVYAFGLLAANPFPGFTGKAGSYPIDLEIDPPGRQNRWKTAFRLLLAVPALWLAGVLLFTVGTGYAYDEQTDEVYQYSFIFGVSAAVAFLAWFVCLVRGRMPTGFRDLLAFTLRFGAQTWGYLLFVTDRYPSADPREPSATQPTPAKPVNLRVEDDLRRSRLTVFFRLLLTIPHFVWLVLWGIVVFLALIVAWFVTLVAGRLPDAFHRFFSAYLRYEIHVFAFLFLVANPFPGFAGAAGSYPVDVEIAPREPQSRWKTLFRIFLAIPAHILNSALGVPLYLAAFFGWFVGLALGRMPEGLRNLGAYVLRYSAQFYAYLYLLTDSYPFTGPAEYVEPEVALEPVPTWPDAPPEPSF
jgi:Domain of unknown function (DUF4389)